MKDIDAAWLAGIFDGEGSINSYFRHEQRRGKGQMYSVFLQVVNTDIEIMEKARAICAVNNKLTRCIRPKRKPLYHLAITRGADVYRILTSIEPYLTSRKLQRARLALRYLNTRLA